MTENQVLKDPIVYTGKGFYAWRVVYNGALSSCIYETEAQARAALAQQWPNAQPPAALDLSQFLARAMKNWLDDKQGHTLYSALDKTIFTNKALVRRIEASHGKLIKVVVTKEILRRTNMTTLREVDGTQRRNDVVKMILQEAVS
jgi:hypothetical protein